jgi:hypothetical protein
MLSVNRMNWRAYFVPRSAPSNSNMPAATPSERANAQPSAPVAPPTVRQVDQRPALSPRDDTTADDQLQVVLEGGGLGEDGVRHRRAAASRYPASVHVHSMCNMCNILVLLLFVFLGYIFIQSWIRAFQKGDYRSVGVSIVFLLLVTYGCCRRRGIFPSDMQQGYASDGDAIMLHRLEPVPQGVSAATLEQLNCFKMHLPSTEELGSGIAPVASVGGRRRTLEVDVELGSHERDCAICLSEYEEGEEMCRLHCGHCFHKECIFQWLSTSTVCPFCKANVPGDGLSL